MFIRIYATARFTYLNPLKAYSNIPINWWHQITCLDSLHPPELIPGIIEYEEEKKYISKLQPLRYYYVTTILSDTHSDYRPISIFGFTLVYVDIRNLLTLITLFFISSVYRWSIKGTSLLMFPMIWLLYDSKNTTPENFTKSLVMTNIFYFSCIILLIFVVFFLKRVIGIDVSIIIPDGIRKILTINDPHGLINQFCPDNTFMLWEFLILLTASLTVCCYIFADRLVNRGDSEITLLRFRQLMSFIGISAVCLIFAFVYLSANIAHIG